MSTHRYKELEQPGRIWRAKSQAYKEHRAGLRNPAASGRTRTVNQNTMNPKALNFQENTETLSAPSASGQDQSMSSNL